MEIDGNGMREIDLPWNIKARAQLQRTGCRGERDSADFANGIKARRDRALADFGLFRSFGSGKIQFGDFTERDFQGAVARAEKGFLLIDAKNLAGVTIGAIAEKDNIAFVVAHAMCAILDPIPVGDDQVGQPHRSRGIGALQGKAISEHRVRIGFGIIRSVFELFDVFPLRGVLAIDEEHNHALAAIAANFHDGIARVRKLHIRLRVHHSLGDDLPRGIVATTIQGKVCLVNVEYESIAVELHLILRHAIEKRHAFLGGGITFLGVVFFLFRRRWGEVGMESDVGIQALAPGESESQDGAFAEAIFANQWFRAFGVIPSSTGVNPGGDFLALGLVLGCCVLWDVGYGLDLDLWLVALRLWFLLQHLPALCGVGADVMNDATDGLRVDCFDFRCREGDFPECMAADDGRFLGHTKHLTGNLIATNETNVSKRFGL